MSFQDPEQVSELLDGLEALQLRETAREDIGNRIADLAGDDTEDPGQFTYLIKPRSFLVIGMLQDFIGTRGGHDQQRFCSFEIFRRNVIEPEIITFDELLAKAEYLAEAVDTESL